MRDVDVDALARQRALEVRAVGGGLAVGRERRGGMADQVVAGARGQRAVRVVDHAQHEPGVEEDERRVQPVGDRLQQVGFVRGGGGAAARLFGGRDALIDGDGRRLLRLRLLDALDQLCEHRILPRGL